MASWEVAVFAALPAGVEHGAAEVAVALRDGQVHLWWEGTPIDMFFAVEQFHIEVGNRCRTVPFGGRLIRVLSAEDLAVFKAMFDRGRTGSTSPPWSNRTGSTSRLQPTVSERSWATTHASNGFSPWRTRVDVGSGSRDA